MWRWTGLLRKLPITNDRFLRLGPPTDQSQYREYRCDQQKAHRWNNQKATLRVMHNHFVLGEVDAFCIE
jgi:hypothetical protein